MWWYLPTNPRTWEVEAGRSVEGLHPHFQFKSRLENLSHEKKKKLIAKIRISLSW